MHHFSVDLAWKLAADRRNELLRSMAGLRRRRIPPMGVVDVTHVTDVTDPRRARRVR